MVFKIFISYSLKDSEIAERIKSNFESMQGVSVFLSGTSLMLGHVSDTILSNIKECDLFVLLYSKNSHESNYVQQEIGAAKANNKTIIPLVLDNEVRPNAMIQDLNYLSVHDDKKLKIEMKKLNEYIQQQTQKRVNVKWIMIAGAVAVIIYLLTKD